MFQNVPLSLCPTFYIHTFWEKNVYSTEPWTIYVYAQLSYNLAELELQNKNEKLWGGEGTKVKRKIKSCNKLH